MALASSCGPRVSSGQGLTMDREQAPPYPDPPAHLRDELYRVWLRVEYEIRSAWERGTLPRVSDDVGLGLWAPDNVAGLFRGARAAYLLQAPGQQDDAGAGVALDAFLRHSARCEARV